MMSNRILDILKQEKTNSRSINNERPHDGWVLKKILDKQLRHRRFRQICCSWYPLWRDPLHCDRENFLGRLNFAIKLAVYFDPQKSKFAKYISVDRNIKTRKLFKKMRFPQKMGRRNFPDYTEKISLWNKLYNCILMDIRMNG